jgi:hypothetical protein
MSDITEPRAAFAHLAETCTHGAVLVSPEVRDYMIGPFGVYYAAARHGCQLDGISGPAPAPRTTPRTPVVATLRWQVDPSLSPPFRLSPVPPSVRPLDERR